MAKRRPTKARKTARKRAPRRTAPDRRAIEAALAGIAHDIRTPLTGIVALSELLASADIGAREREWAQSLKISADHLAAVTTLIVDAAKADAKGLVLRNEPFSPRLLAETVAQALKARADLERIGSTIAITSDFPPLVSADVLRLRSALENLSDNAVKFTSKGTVTFSASAEPAGRDRVRLTFTFADTGIGMSPAELKSLLRPFAQASDDIARRYGGAGLGLSFVKRVARAMGGDLKIVSKTGQGSTFTLTVLAAATRRRAR